MTQTSTQDPATLQAYLASCGQAFERACAVQPLQETRLQVGQAQFHLRIAGQHLPEVILPALAHLMIADEKPASQVIGLNIWQANPGGVWPEPPPFTPGDYRRYGQRAVAHAAGCSIMYSLNDRQLFAYDRESRQGYFWAEDLGQASIYERAAPLQTLFHWALQAFGWHIVHAAAIGTAQGGLLLIGSSGSGKSTTALSCLAHPSGLKLLSDDKCLVSLESQPPQAQSLFSSAKIKADMLARLPEFSAQLQGWDTCFKAEKGLLFLHPTYAPDLIASFPLKALVVTQISGKAEAASFSPISPAQIFRALGPSTIIWLPGAEQEHYRFMAALASRLPCYRLNLSTDLQANSQAILRFLEACA
jgi:hypothetical protein